jgi:hypothetical protein
MSGGYFNYDQHRIAQITDDIQNLIDINNSKEKDMYGDDISRHLPDKIIEYFKEAIIVLRRANFMTHHIDYLMSGDIDPESFMKRWNRDCKD